MTDEIRVRIVKCQSLKLQSFAKIQKISKKSKDLITFVELNVAKPIISIIAVSSSSFLPIKNYTLKQMYMIFVNNIR